MNSFWHGFAIVLGGVWHAEIWPAIVKWWLIRADNRTSANRSGSK